MGVLGHHAVDAAVAHPDRDDPQAGVGVVRVRLDDEVLRGAQIHAVVLPENGTTHGVRKVLKVPTE